MDACIAISVVVLCAIIPSRPNDHTRPDQAEEKGMLEEHNSTPRRMGGDNELCTPNTAVCGVARIQTAGVARTAPTGNKLETKHQQSYERKKMSEGN
jgi:hypothetical protein